MIAIVDHITAPGTVILALRDRYLDAYAPAARGRGMTLSASLLAPPVPIPHGENVLTFVWHVPDLPAWWRARLSAAGDPAVATFWAEIDAVATARRRSHSLVGDSDV